MDVILLSRQEIRERTIEPLDYKLTEPINGLETFEFQCLDDIYRIDKKKRVLFKTELGIWKEFIIESFEKLHTDEGVIVNVYAENSITETTGDYIEDRRPTNQTAAGALKIALETSRWKIGTVDVPGLKSTTFYRCSVHEAIAKVIEVWGGEIRTRVTVQDNKITGRYVDLFQRRGADRGRRFEWTKDIEEIKRKVSEDQIVTALYGYGKGIQIGDGYSRRIDFAEINGGKAYVENNEARLRYGPKNADGTSRHIFGKYECDFETPEEVLADTRKKLEELSTEKVSYEAKVINLAKYGFEVEGVELGDDVRIIDKEIGTVRARVTVKVTRPDNQEDDLIIGNFVDDYSERIINTGNKISEFASKAGIWDRAVAFDNDGKIGASFLKDILQAFNTELNASTGYVYAEPGKGISTYDKPPDQNPQGVTQIMAAGLRIASSKLADGSWNWKTAMTSMGIIADVIYTGRIVGNTSYYDLDAGELSFTATMSGKKINVKMSVAQGFEIFVNGTKIGGLGIVDGKVFLMASALSNMQEGTYAEIGELQLSGILAGSQANKGIKINYKRPDGTRHNVGLATGGNNTGIIFFDDLNAFANLSPTSFMFHVMGRDNSGPGGYGINLTGDQYRAGFGFMHYPTYGDAGGVTDSSIEFSQAGTVLNAAGILTMNSDNFNVSKIGDTTKVRTPDNLNIEARNINMFKSGSITQFRTSDELQIVSESKISLWLGTNAIGIDANGPWFQKAGSGKKYFT